MAELPAQRFAAAHGLAKALPPPLRPPDTRDLPESGDWLVIPAINVREQVWEGKSLDVLWTHEGVWHQAGSLQHNLVLAGHRFQYLPPNTDTFYNLGLLKKGESITVVWDGKPYGYAVDGETTVLPTDSEPLNQGGLPRLTLYTCSDWATTHRLVVTASLVVSQATDGH